MNKPDMLIRTDGQQDHRGPVFIHSLWRSGSTYLFSVFRRSTDGYWCYQEPVHEIALLSKDSPENLLSFVGDRMRALRHPALTDSYFLELYEVAAHWREVITKPMIYDEYFSTQTENRLMDYLTALITHAKGRPVIQECRTSCRVGAIKKALGGTHIYLWRNPWDQWWSYKSTYYFDLTSQLILNAPGHPDVIARLKKEIGFECFHSNDINQELAYFDRNRLSAEHSYLVFYMLWCLGLFEGIDHADQLLNIDTLSTGQHYRDEVRQQLRQFGVTNIDFSDCKVPQTYYDAKDKDFFVALEDQVHGLLLLSGFSQAKLDRLQSLRQSNEPELWAAPTTDMVAEKILADGVRAREIVVRFETENAARLARTSHQLANQQSEQAQQAAAQLHMAQQQAASDQVELVRSFDEQKQSFQRQHAEQERALQREHAMREQILSQELQASQEELRRVEQTQSKREQLLVEQTGKSRRELDDVLHTLVQREQSVGAQLLAIQQQAAVEKTELIHRHRDQEFALTLQQNERAQELRAELQASQDERLDLQKDRARREQEVGTQILTSHQQAMQELAAQASRHQVETAALHRQQSEREAALNLQLQAGQQELRRLEQDRAVREKEFAEQYSQVRRESESLLSACNDQHSEREQLLRAELHASQTALQDAQKDRARREQEVGAQVLAHHQQAMQELAVLASRHQAETAALHRQQGEREVALNLQLQAGQQQLRRLEQDRAVREKEFAEQHSLVSQENESLLAANNHQHSEREQLLRTELQASQIALQDLQKDRARREQEVGTQLLESHQQAMQELAVQARRHLEETAALHRQHAELEVALNLQLHEGQQELRLLEQDQLMREEEFAEQYRLAREESENLLSIQVRREQEVIGELLTVQQQTEQEKAEQLRQHGDQLDALQHQHHVREQILIRQQQSVQENLSRQEQAWALREEVLTKELAVSQALDLAQQLQAQRYEAELATRLAEHQQLTDACTALEGQLRAEILAEQDASLQLLQRLSEVQQSLATTHGSLVWKITAPLRKLASFASPKNKPNLASSIMSEAKPPQASISPGLKLPQLIGQPASIEAIMLTPVSVINPPLSFVAATLDELMALHDQYFVHCAYQTLLGRAPDSEGLGYYLGRLRAGFPKIQTLVQICLSKEGKTREVALFGLSTAIQSYRREHYPLLGWIFMLFNNPEGNHPVERKLRGIKNQLFLISNESSCRFDKIEAALNALQQLVVLQTQSAGMAFTENLLPNNISKKVKDDNKIFQLSNNNNFKESHDLLYIENLIAISKEIK
ncbi:DUF4214 domain-containing protein [Actimicrobium sp. CCI2.3]|uniref:DUF4214 domain-containing protein n=1 Tax=Actimicrobium sp. CCI2.3 TaxID=3048616 RepID=UPI002AB45369|nr:DUF4214 domain-containing protein [Actimicrobium sp. CCI2.3]MDY7573969.1 DUF4214 domain-containing protein [Actimicrobium sp. CCI2.3]MEB0023100.1 DUF4214 domain-containing protein [Actimicrobium sp. CCI2.3]